MFVAGKDCNLQFVRWLRLYVVWLAAAFGVVFDVTLGLFIRQRLARRLVEWLWVCACYSKSALFRNDAVFPTLSSNAIKKNLGLLPYEEQSFLQIFWHIFWVSLRKTFTYGIEPVLHREFFDSQSSIRISKRTRVTMEQVFWVTKITRKDIEVKLYCSAYFRDIFMRSTKCSILN